MQSLEGSSAAAASIVGALTDELLRALIEACESDARVVFRGVLARIVSLNNELFARREADGVLDLGQGDGAQERERQRLLQVVASIGRAVQSERVVTQGSRTTIAEEHQVVPRIAAEVAGQTNDRGKCDALRMLVLAPFRAAFAQYLHEQVTLISRSIRHSVGSDAEPLMVDECGVGGVEDEEPVGSSEEPEPEDEEIDVSDTVAWREQWADDCLAQATYFHAVLDALEDHDNDDGDDDAESDSSSGASGDDSETSDGAVGSPGERIIAQMLEGHQMDDGYRDFFERALLLMTEGQRVPTMLASTRENSRWRRFRAQLNGTTWRSLYASDTCIDGSALPLVAEVDRPLQLVSRSTTTSRGGSDRSNHPFWSEDASIARRTPKWLIPASEISLICISSDNSYHSCGISGRWLDAEVLFKPIRHDWGSDNADESVNSSLVVEGLEQCYQLNHPNVTRLYGACYNGEQYFCVCEYEEWSSLSDFAQFTDDKNVWQVLYEAALGLQFLHGSGVVHGNLRQSSIVIGSDGLANIDVIGTRKGIMEDTMLIDRCFESGKAQWAAPECLRGAPGSFESDIYSFGMLILGEFNESNSAPWGNEEYSIHTMHQVAKTGDLPPRPEELDDLEWAYVTRICAFDSTQRPNISSIVHFISDVVDAFNEPNEEADANPSKRDTWKRILEAAKVLEHLHDEVCICIGVIDSLDTIYNCDPGDYLGSTETALVSARAGHLNQRWVAPEAVSAGPNDGGANHQCEASYSFQSDIYSLGILIIEAVTREHAWGSATLDVVAGVAKLQGFLPPQPFSFSGEQWQLVERMCAHDAASRLSISQVVDELHQFAYDKSAGIAEAEGNESSTSSICDLEEYQGDNDWGEEDARPVDEESPTDSDDGAEFLVPTLGLPVHAVLQNMKELLEIDPKINIEANWDVLRRLESIYRLASLSAGTLADDSQDSKHIALELFNHYCAALLRFWHFLYESSSSNLALTPANLQGYKLDRTPIASSSYVRNNFVFHRLLDSVMQMLTDARSMSSTAISVHNWRAKWFKARNSQLRVFAVRMSIDSSIEEESSGDDVASNGSESDQDPSTDDEYAGGSSYLNDVGCGLGTSDKALSVPLPPWFIPAYDVVFDELHLLGSGSFGSVHKATWLGAPVVVKKIISSFDSDASRALFDREVSIWYRLHHPHIVKLFGACHVGHPFFVCEFALFGRLDRYLIHRARQQQRDGSFSRAQLAWTKIYEACLGLQYLHERGVIHADLKCDNILVAMDGKAKLSDFGLSSVVRTRRKQRFQREEKASDAMCIGAIRWKAPEVLAGESPTRASDVYGMAMCLIEAVTGLFPWGNSIPDAAVNFHVKRGRLPKRPLSFSRAEWQLVKAMCCFNPDERLRIGDVVKVLAARAELAQLREATLL